MAFLGISSAMIDTTQIFPEVLFLNPELQLKPKSLPYLVPLDGTERQLLRLLFLYQLELQSHPLGVSVAFLGVKVIKPPQLIFLFLAASI